MKVGKPKRSPTPQLLSTQKMPSAEGVYTAPPQCSYRSPIIATNSVHQHLQCIFSTAEVIQITNVGFKNITQCVMP